MRRLVDRALSVAVLTAVWVALVGRVSALVVISGVVLGALICVLFPMPPVPWPGRLRPWGLARLVVGVAWDLVVASVHLACFALDWRRRPRSGVVRVRLSSDADIYQVATATLLSIVPGSVVVEARSRSRTLYMHVFDVREHTVAQVRVQALVNELRVLRALGTREEIEECRTALARAREQVRSHEAHRPQTGPRSRRTGRGPASAQAGAPVQEQPGARARVDAPTRVPHAGAAPAPTRREASGSEAGGGEDA